MFTLGDLEGDRPEDALTRPVRCVDDEVTAAFAAARDALAMIARSSTADAFFNGAQEIGITVGAILSPEEAFDDPHFVARGFPVEVDHPERDEPVRYPGAPWVFHGSPWELRARAPRVGEHNEAAFDALGVSESRRKALRESGVV